MLLNDRFVIMLVKNTINNDNINFIDLVNVKRLHNKGITGTGIKIGIIDTSFTEDYHGYQVENIIKQMAPDALITEYSYTTNDFASIINQIKQCITDKIQIINMSIGINKVVTELKGYEEELHDLEIACNEASDEGIIIICGAGNNGYNADGDLIDYPAAFSSTISIGGVDKNNNWMTVSDVNEYVDFVTYGKDIEIVRNNEIVSKVSGTSYSCPIATGIVALMLEQNKQLAKVDIMYLLKKYAEDLGTIGKDKAYGYGLIKAIEIPDDYTLIKEIFLGDANFLKEQYNVTELFNNNIYGDGIQIGIVGYGCSNLDDFNIKEFHNFAHDAKNQDISFAYQENIANAFSCPIISKSIGLCPNSINYLLRDISDYGGFAREDSSDVNNWCLANTDKLDIVLVFPYTPVSVLKTLSDAGIICVMCCYDNSTALMEGSKGQNTGNQYAITVSYINPDKTIDNDSYVCEEIDCVGFGYGYGILTTSGEVSLSASAIQGDKWRSMCAACQVMGILALIKQQNPEINNAEKVREILPDLCESLPYDANKVGNGLIKAKII